MNQMRAGDAIAPLYQKKPEEAYHIAGHGTAIHLKPDIIPSRPLDTKEDDEVSDEDFGDTEENLVHA